MRSSPWPWLNALALALTITANGLANALPINGQTTGEVSDRFEVYFVPAGYVFSIWGLIYLALLAFVIDGLLRRESPLHERVGGWFALSCLANAAWLVLWHYERFAGTVALMLTLLVSLCAIYLRLDPGRAGASRRDRALVLFPFSLYLGWVSVATIANVTSYLDFIAWSGWGLEPARWMQVMLGVTATLCAIMTARTRDVVYLLVIIWALVGIALKHAAVPAVASASWLTAGVVGLLALISLALRWRARA